MKPKKKDQTIEDESKLQFERLQADHEMFLQAFEKPTQIYRYLRSRCVVSPIMLQRNLSYMQERSTRKSNTRRGFKIDSILEKVQAKFMKDNPNYSYKSEFMNLAFTGFFDQSGQGKVVEAEVEVMLLKICHKKRKDVSSPVLTVSLGKIMVPINPENLDNMPKIDGISVASENFSPNNGHTVKSYTLLFRVKCTREQPSDTSQEPALVNGVCNGDINDGHKSDEEPSPKRRRISVNQGSHHSTQGDTSQQSPDKQTTSNSTNSTGLSHSSQDVLSCDTYGAELIIYDKFQRCLLTEGDYELALQDLRLKQPSKKQGTWETIMDGRAVGPFEVFNKCPTLKFKLTWNRLPLDIKDSGHQESDAEEEEEETDTIMEVAGSKVIVPKNYIPKMDHLERRNKECVSPSKRKRIFYQFLYNNNTRQQTEARDDLHCPWCSLSCLRLYPLLKHLRTFHARFNFAYVEHPKGARIDVSINQCYDGAYVGNPQDLNSHIGYAFSRNGPVRRTPVTHLLVYRPKKPSLDLAEFTEPESETHSTRQVVQGHNRLYYHTVTCRPVRACEIDNDSEDENDPLWLRQKTLNMIDEFTDVNEGEKEVMKMWNLHVMHHNILGDCQMAKACLTFVEEYGTQILQQNLTRNFLLHLVNLSDFGLLRPEVMYRTMMIMLQLRNRLEVLGHLPHDNVTPSDLATSLNERLQQDIIDSSYQSYSVQSTVAPSPASQQGDMT